MSELLVQSQAHWVTLVFTDSGSKRCSCYFVASDVTESSCGRCCWYWYLRGGRVRCVLGACSGRFPPSLSPDSTQWMPHHLARLQSTLSPWPSPFCGESTQSATSERQCCASLAMLPSRGSIPQLRSCMSEPWSRFRSHLTNVEPSPLRSCPKTMSGGKQVPAHFKVALHGSDNGRNIKHDCLIKICHRDTSGQIRRYQSNLRAHGYDYSTMVARNGAPNNCPRNKRLQRERAAEEARKAAAAAA